MKQCIKAQFPSKKAAKTKINSLIKFGHWNKKDTDSRTYYCNECRMWHMTSMHEIEFNARLKPLVIKPAFTDRWNTLLKKDI